MNRNLGNIGRPIGRIYTQFNREKVRFSALQKEREEGVRQASPPVTPQDVALLV